MSRYTGPSARINRRFGQSIFPTAKVRDHKNHPPGIHGPRLRRKNSDYSVGLNEKQKLRYMFGLTEKQFRLTFERAKRIRGITGQIFLQLLETRLDNVVYQAGFSRTRRAARQLVNHGHVSVNGKKVDIPSYTTKPGDVIEIRQRPSSRQLATRGVEESQFRTPPAWLAVESDSLKATVSRAPIPEEMEQSVNVQLIVEFYSR